MKKQITLLTLLLSFSLIAQIERPKLVVGIVVDQMRTDYLYRYYDDYGNNGFKRLLKEGFNFKNTQYNYMPTYTAPGHSSIYTGTTPAIHGIVGNSWYNKAEKAKVYCTTDINVESIGTKKKDDYAGQMSPHRLKATTVTDALKMDTNNRAKVVSISIKDRGAILPGGHFADAVYWMDSNGKFITSSFYMNQLPQWVTKVNEEDEAQKYINQGWNLLKPIATYDESLEDDNPYEAIFEPKKTPTFPYNLKEIAALQGNNGIIKSTPFANTMVKDLSEKAIINEGLGKDNFTDFLAISFSSTDYVGHAFGPRSIEIQDTYLRLDQDIAQLLSFLDETVGKGEYLVFLTADHAAAENPRYLADMGYNVKNLNSSAFTKELINHFDEKYGEGTIVNYSNQNVFLDEDLIKENKLEYDQVVADIIEYCQAKPYIKRAYSRKDILRGNATDYNLSLIERGFDPKQNGDIVILYDPQYMEYGETGTSHGSSYAYDTHVPNLWFGWNVTPGESFDLHDITEIAPTLSHKLSIPVPNANEGKVMKEILP